MGRLDKMKWRMQLKCICLIIFSISFWAMPALANAEAETNVALKGGIDTAASDSDSSTSRYGFTGGLAGSFKWPLIGRVTLAGQADLLYTPRGTKTIFEGAYLGQTRLHYFDVTIVARPEVQFGTIGFYFLLGGGLNLLLNADKENVSGAQEDITGELRRYDIALLAGVGVAFHLPVEPMGALHLGTVFLEARHDHGLLYVDAVNDVLKNRTTSLMLGLSFTLSPRRAAAQLAPSSSSASEPSAAAAAMFGRE